MQMGFFKRYAYAWITVGFFLVSLVLHFMFGWASFQNEARQHGHTPDLHGFMMEMGRDIFENWQSEFLQLLWQVVGLAYFLYVGSPASKENDDRMEAKIDALLRITGGAEGDALVGKLDEHYARDHGHAGPYEHDHDLAQNAGRNVPHVAMRS
jgi:hypothetical protein